VSIRYTVFFVGVMVTSAVCYSVAARAARASDKGQSPKYTVVSPMTNGVEIRQYPSSVVAQVEVSGDEREALNEGFRILAGYIFGKNIGRKSIDMTAPVVAHPEKIKMTTPVTSRSMDNTMTVSFFMPDGYSLSSLPEPQDSRIHFVQLPARKLAAIRFSGSWNPVAFAKHAEELVKRLRLSNLEPDGEPYYAYYNPPFTPPILRRNEVLVPMSDEDVQSG